MGGIGRLVRIVILVAVALALVLTVALPPPSAAAATASPAPDVAATEPAEPTSLGGRWRTSAEYARCAAAPDLTATPDLTAAQPRPDARAALPSGLEASAVTAIRPRSLGGRWRTMARPPFATSDDAAGFAWTGRGLIVVQPRLGRTAAYDPRADAWRELPRVPRPFDTLSGSIWTGRELVILGTWRGELVGLALDHEREAWHELPDSPLTRNPFGGGVVRDAVWAGDRLLVSSHLGHEVAAYDPDGDCWEMLPSIPADVDERITDDEPRPGTLFWTGTEILALTWDPPIDPNLARGRSLLWRFDSTTRTWVDTGPTPLAGGWPGGLWAVDRLWFLGGPRDEAGIVSGATYDPISGTWQVFGLECGPHTGDAQWTGRLILDAYAALDPATGVCYRLPTVNDRTRRDPVTIWTGRELIVWSGGQGEELRAKPDGVVYRPPSKAIEDR